ncbi:MAG: hypothetical protein WD270_03445 [Acetobacterales bacterium]
MAEKLAFEHARGREVVFTRTDAEALSSVLTGAFPAITFWEVRQTAGVPRMAQIDSLADGVETGKYALIVPENWAWRVERNETTGLLRFAAFPRLYLLSLEPYISWAAKPHPKLLERNIRVFQPGRFLSSFWSDDPEARHFVSKAFRQHRKLLKNTVVAVDLLTGRRQHGKDISDWYMDGAARACSEDPDLFLALRYQPQQNILWGYKPVE